MKSNTQEYDRKIKDATFKIEDLESKLQDNNKLKE
jgi:hypothetical protein